MSITVCIATIPPRVIELRKALESVAKQTLLPATIVVEYDHHKTGAAATKNRAIEKATTEWVAMLDDDDEFMPLHLESLLKCAIETNSDLVYSVPLVPQIPGGIAHGITRDFLPFDETEYRRRSYIQSNVLARRSTLIRSGGFQCPPGSIYDDWGLGLGILDVGGKIVHLPEQTFIWNHWGGNTSGQPSRW